MLRKFGLALIYTALSLGANPAAATDLAPLMTGEMRKLIPAEVPVALPAAVAAVHALPCPDMPGHRLRHQSAPGACCTKTPAVEGPASTHLMMMQRTPGPAAETKVALVQRSCGYALRPTLR